MNLSNDVLAYDLNSIASSRNDQLPIKGEEDQSVLWDNNYLDTVIQKTQKILNLPPDFNDSLAVDDNTYILPWLKCEDASCVQHLFIPEPSDKWKRQTNHLHIWM